MQKLSIDGIKRSEAMTQMTAGNPQVGEQLLAVLSANRINVHFVSACLEQDPMVGSCCILAADTRKVEGLLKDHPAVTAAIEWIHAVGIVSLYPHRGRLQVLGQVLQTSRQLDLPIYALATSFSTISLSTAFRHIDRFIAHLCRRLVLPANHAPFAPQFRIHGRLKS